VQVCPRCQRVNPREAAFCYFDGHLLRHGAGAGPAQLPQEFVFPSGRRCRNFDDLVQGCQYEWEDAREMLRRGDFTRYLAQIGRHDLVRGAQEGQSGPDPDIALHQFLSQLPASQVVQGPRLDLIPRRLTLQMRRGEHRLLHLTVTNQGKGLLQGKVTVTEGGQWLKITGGQAEDQCSLKTARTQQIALRIDARNLIAPQTYSAKLTVVTNGGVAEVPVRLDLGAMPFPRPPFQGAGSPRELAERMRSHPKQAVPLLESGEIARWFLSNGWAYPVAGPCASGVAAVQQFFEGMGLSKPPPLQLSDEELRFMCVPPEVLPAQVTLRTPSRKWVYAQVETDVPWLRVTTPVVSGPQQVQIGFEIDTTLVDAGRAHLGTLKVTANAGQVLAVRVHADVRRPHEPFTRRLLRPFFVGAILALLWRLVLAGPADLYARGLARSGSPAIPETLEQWMAPPGAEDNFLRLFILATWWLGALVGVGLVWRRGGRLTDVFCGAVAGAGAGLIGSATLGCLLLVFDALPRALLTHVGAFHSWSASPWTCLVVWVALASFCWAVLGAGVGFLLSGLGQWGRQLLEAAARPFAWLCRACGLERTAAFFLLRG
jgi:hypothetical protein